MHAAVRAKQQTGDPASCPPRLPAIRAGTHIVALHSRRAECDALLYPYLRDGLSRDHSCTACLSSGPGEPVLDRLADEMDVDAKRASGQLSICHAADWPIPREQDGAEAASTLWDHVTTQHPAHGFPFVRFAVEANAWPFHLDDPDEFLRFESRFTTLADGRPVAFMFMYDVSDLDGALVVELVRTHPTVWTYGVVLVNPYYSAPPGSGRLGR